MIAEVSIIVALLFALIYLFDARGFLAALAEGFIGLAVPALVIAACVKVVFFL